MLSEEQDYDTPRSCSTCDRWVADTPFLSASLRSEMLFAIRFSRRMALIDFAPRVFDNAQASPPNVHSNSTEFNAWQSPG